ncbi:oxidoreductase [Paenibacillus sp. N1-5-1-14]|uniref:oxidoreductase n=1 Tax=Paenibacillus radicibacter TaxID=2972488 RepID=UPI0021597A1E|nr:oxidoreductase [Paenibacillus radicibacter]MCR8644725.1 oxidoreductase [Paenibacillus radicibacter]
MGRTAWIVGGTGVVGTELVKQALESKAYSRVVMLVRKPISLTHPKLEQREVEFNKLADYEFMMNGDDVFCCLGTTIKKAGSQQAFRLVDYDYPVQLAQIAKKQGAQRFLIITAMGANARSIIFYSRVKGELEQQLQALGLPALHIFRPSLITGNRQDRRSGEAFAVILMKVLNPLLVGPMRKYRSIDAAVIASAMLHATDQQTEGSSIYNSDQIADLGKI